MAAPVLTRRGARSRHRAAALLWFVLIAFPILAFGSALAVDFTRLVVAGREASNVAEASAVAGAQQFQANTYRLDAAQARAAAASSAQHSADVGALRSTLNSTTARVTDNAYSSQRVTVTLDVTVDGLVFLPIIDAVAGSDVGSTADLQITRSADVCRPGVYDPTGGACARPVLR